MHLARAFRCLSRPSSAVKPSHPPTSVADLHCFNLGLKLIVCILMHGLMNMIQSFCCRNNIILQPNYRHCLSVGNYHLINDCEQNLKNLFSNSFCDNKMDPPGFEPGAPGVQDRCSTRLSYRPIWTCTIFIMLCWAKHAWCWRWNILHFTDMKIKKSQ